MNAIDYAMQQSQKLEQLARATADDTERKYHTQAMRLWDKAAHQLAEGNAPIRLGEMWLVRSATKGGAVYRISAHSLLCNCEAGMCNRTCHHLLMVEAVAQDVVDVTGTIRASPLAQTDPSPPDDYDEDTPDIRRPSLESETPVTNWSEWYNTDWSDPSTKELARRVSGE